ncbi:MAG: class I tRNA ligase family protein, partial [Thiohalocapsa sp.]
MLDKTYDPHRIEAQWYQRWEDAGWFAPRLDAGAEAAADGASAYCIMIPPPNVTGSLHMGHGFNNSLMDALIRYHR